GQRGRSDLDSAQAAARPTYDTITSQIHPGPGHSWPLKTHPGSLYQVRLLSGTLLSPFARVDLLRGSHGLGVPSHQGTPTVSLQRQHRRPRRAFSLRRYSGPRDARFEGIDPAHEARPPARGSLRAQRGRSDLDCAQTATRPRALNDGLWLRAANFGGHTAQDQRYRPRPYAVASACRQGP